jgi:hypothetical protein
MAMILANSHPVAAALTVSEVPGYPQQRFGMLVAKATYRIRAGACEADPARARPILAADKPTPLGDLPRDDLPRSDPAFEVIMLGTAHAPGGTPCERLTVSLSVGAERREMLVHGDRRWEHALLRHRPGACAPFTSMPLTWSRAFGGSARVEIDHEAFVDVCDVRNPAGRGFDPGPDAVGLAKHLKSPKGYPRYDKERPLANLEHPQHAVSRFDDAPDPLCWATVPMTTSIHGMRILNAPGSAAAGPGLFHRAHPQWVLPQPPPAGARVVLSGATPDGELSFALPRQRIDLEVFAGGTTLTVAARPQLLVLLPDEQACYLVHRAFFCVPPPAGEQRSARLLLGDGWAVP